MTKSFNPIYNSLIGGAPPPPATIDDVTDRLYTSTPTDTKLRDTLMQLQF